MIKTYKFTPGGWDPDDFFYAYSPRWHTRKQFLQEEDCISNIYDDKHLHYISILTKKKYKAGVRLKTKCSFKSFGAPLIVFSNDVALNEKGDMMYGLHFEGVAWFKGLNAWRVIALPERVERPFHATLIGSTGFTIEDEAICEIDMEIREKEICVGIDGHYITVQHDEIPEEFHVGITACEGHNKFYDFTIEE